MAAQVIPFNFESSSASIRVIEIDGEPWFIAKDVAEALEYAESSLETIGKLIANVPTEWVDRKRIPVPDEWKGTNPIRTPGGDQDMVILSEPGLYFFVARSDKPKALPFQKWLAGDVLPSLRKRGFYGLMPAGERMKHHATLSRTVKQLSHSRDALEQHILLQQVEDICHLLGIKMPSVTLLHTVAPQLELAEV